MSIIYQGLRNYFMMFGKLSETVLMFSYAYIPPINVAFGTRNVIFWHFGIPGLPFSMLQMVFAEIMKYGIRNAKVK
jgi:sodium/potassium-transporting ATPase subunit alpha